MDFNRDYFSLFGIEPRFRIDPRALERAWRALQAQVHPDRYADRPQTEQRLSMQWATRVNEGYRTLRSPLTRARYLLGLRGVDLDHPASAGVSTDFLSEQMEWREALAEARGEGDAAALEALRRRLEAQMRSLTDELAGAIDERSDWEAAADCARRLMFMDKLDRELSEAASVLEG
ncbi:MAG: Fe-S protein assembly co-chaperone HscB [Rhodocyclaceae bacterium]